MAGWTLAVRAGLGLATVPSSVAHDSVRDGVPHPLLTDGDAARAEIRAVFSRPRWVPTKVGGFADLLQPCFGAE